LFRALVSVLFPEKIQMDQSVPADVMYVKWSSPLRITNASNEGNSWWDFWPEPVKSGSNLALLYSSERSSDGTYQSDGNMAVTNYSPLICFT